MNIQSLMANYQEVIKVFKKHGFTNPILFKGFNNKELHNFNILVNDAYKDTDLDTTIKPLDHRRLAVFDELTELMQCNVIISTPKNMKERYVKMLDDTNSISLTGEIPVIKLLSLFGEEWTFNPIPKMASHPNDTQPTLFKKPIEGNCKSEISSTADLRRSSNDILASGNDLSRSKK